MGRLLQELVNSFGAWDEKQRRLVIDAGAPKIWGTHDTNSRIAPGQFYWLPSGAAHLNLLATMHANAEVTLSEVSNAACLARGLRIASSEVAC